MSSEKGYKTHHLITIGLLLVVARGLFRPLYLYGVSNHTNQLPLIKHTIDPSYLSTDWSVAVRTGLGSPRFIYTQFLAGLGRFMGVQEAVLLIYVLSTLLGVAALYKLTEALVNDRLAGVLVVGIYLSPVIRIIDFGGNKLILRYLIPSHLANALILVGLYWTLQRRYRWAFGLLGIATLFHVVNGFWMAVVAGVCAIALESRTAFRRRDFKAGMSRIPWDGAAVYGLIALIAVLPLLGENLAADVGFHAIYLMAWVRHPHHYVPSTWPLWQLLLTAGFTILATIVTYYFRDRIFAGESGMVFGFSMVGTLLVVHLTGGIFTEILPLAIVIKLQPFHVDDFLFLIPFVGLVTLGLETVHLVVEREWGVDGPRVATLSVILVLILMVVAAGTVTGFTIASGPRYDADLADSYAWIGTETPGDATFIASPSQEGFRLESSRAMVVNIKSFPFRPTAMLEWGQRIKAVCGFKAPLTDAKLERCNQRFNHHSERTIRKLATTYDACWLLTENRTYSFEQRYSNDEYVVYWLGNSTACGEGS